MNKPVRVGDKFEIMRDKPGTFARGTAGQIIEVIEINPNYFEEGDQIVFQVPDEDGTYSCSQSTCFGWKEYTGDFKRRRRSTKTTIERAAKANRAKNVK